MTEDGVCCPVCYIQGPADDQNYILTTVVCDGVLTDAGAVIYHMSSNERGPSQFSKKGTPPPTLSPANSTYPFSSPLLLFHHPFRMASPSFMVESNHLRRALCLNPIGALFSPGAAQTTSCTSEDGARFPPLDNPLFTESQNNQDRFEAVG